MTRKFELSTRGLLISSALAATACILCAPVSAERLPNEQPTKVNGIVATCTGTGSGSRQHAQTMNYPVRFEFVGGYGQYLGDETVTVEEQSQCDGFGVVQFALGDDAIAAGPLSGDGGLARRTDQNPLGDRRQWRRPESGLFPLSPHDGGCTAIVQLCQQRRLQRTAIDERRQRHAAGACERRSFEPAAAQWPIGRAGAGREWNFDQPAAFAGKHEPTSPLTASAICLELTLARCRSIR